MALRALGWISLGLFAPGLPAFSPPSISDIRIDEQGRAHVQVAASPSDYLILYRGDKVTEILTEVDLGPASSRGQATEVELIERIPPFGGAARFYRVEQVAVGTPKDSDEDGMDDVFELRHYPILDPLDRLDAGGDPDRDARSNLTEYRLGSNPLVADPPAAPATPRPAELPAATQGRFIEITGIAPANTYVRVEGGSAVATNTVRSDGVFSVPVVLATNRLNRLFVSSVGAGGVTSPGQPLEILQDSQPPTVFADFPTNTAVVATTNTLVAGRVGDALSGYAGLSVWVHSAPSEGASPAATTRFAANSPFRATVDVGIGPNGTFERGAVPLQPGSNVVSVLAEDALGNRALRQLTVIQRTPVGPRVVLVSGDRQAGVVSRRLGEALAVRVTGADGVARAGTPLLFETTRSDGRLLPVNTNLLTADWRAEPNATTNGAMRLWLKTDAAGEARVWLTLGSDAGCANNRVCVSSTELENAVFFCANALPRPARQLNLGSGNQQKVETGNPVPEPLRVWASDGLNPAASVLVSYRVVKGGGYLIPGGRDGKPMLQGPRPSASTGEGETTLTVATGVTGHASVGFVAGREPGPNVVEATFPGQIGLPVSFMVQGVVRDPENPGNFTGLILDNTSCPIGGAICTLTTGNFQQSTTSDSQGRFRFDRVPGGMGHLHVNGRLATHLQGARIPTNSFPSLNYSVITVANADNALPTPVLLPRLNPANAVVYYGTNDLVLTCAGVEGLRFTIQAGSMTDERGNRVSAENPAVVSLDQVHHDDVPMPMPDGVAPPFAWTFQPGGARFDPERPVQVEYPNMSGLAPGAIAYFLSFNHDTERFEIVASGSVTSDGSTIVSDPGSGITLAGWGCNCPPYAVAGDCERGPDPDPDPWDGADNGDGGPSGPGGPGGEGGPDGPDGPDDQEPAQDEDCPPGTPGCQQNCDQELTDPIYLFSGEMYLDVEDLRVPGRGFDFIWSRKYRSKLGLDTPMGRGWDHSYNLLLEPDGTNYFVCNGRARKDRFRSRSDGTWAKTEFFQSLSPNPDGTLTMLLADQLKWHFRRFDGTPAQGKIAAIEDRNGNTMRFDYDGLGRLTLVTDTLGRPFRIDYTAEGYVERVADFSGRFVRYEYYASGDSGGDRGDLKAAISPAVIGTPTGNDFPDGKRTSYTYSTGHADERLNHNLLTVTDGRRNDPRDPTFGLGPYVSNVYATETDPQALLYDRVVRQTWGGGLIDLTYVRLPAALPENNLAVLKVILRDRVGNVKELFYDRRNRLVIRREFTGRADPAVPVTETSNRPTAPLRASDPVYFETRYVWNAESLIRMVTHPRGDKVIYTYESDRNPDASPRTRGNLRHLRRVPASREPLVASLNDQAALVEEFDYDSDFAGGGCCGFNFVTRHRDGRGHATTHTYDSRGNRLRTEHRLAEVLEDFEYNEFGQLTAHTHPDNGSGHRRRDEVQYFADGPQRGYVRRRIVDATRFGLTTSYEYDAVGNIVRQVDPRGDDRRFVVNALNQIVRTLSPVVHPASGIRYTNDFVFDANNNLVRVDVENWTDSGAGPARSLDNPIWTTLHTYDLLNHRLQTSREVEKDQYVVTQNEYDANRNLTVIRQGEAVAGRQPDNVVRTWYDERDLPFRVTRGAGGSTPSTTQHDYDANGNRHLVWHGLEDAPRRAETVYDGFNRAALEIDPMGNTTRRHFDSNGNVVDEVVWGELEDLPGASGNVRLSQHWRRYDALDRLTREDSAFFDPANGAPFDDGARTTLHRYSAASDTVEIVNDNGHATRLSYDTAGRLSVRTDAKGNSVTLTYDAANNVVRQEDRDKHDLGLPDEVFVTTFGSDGLGRLIAVTNSVGSVTRYGFDSRNNQAVRVDALGNVVHQMHDGLDRLIRTEREMRAGGVGTGALLGRIVTRQIWDNSSRLTQQIDDNLNATTYLYDGLDRRFATLMADGTGVTNRLDAHGNAVETWDANGSHWTSQYDANDRLVGRDVHPGPGVAATTTFEKYTYDGESRLVRGENDASRFVRHHDSLGRIVSETLDGQTSRTRWDGQGNALSLTYPGGQEIHSTFDSLERMATVAEPGGPIARYHYVGRDRVARRQYANGTQTDYEYTGASRPGASTGDLSVLKLAAIRHLRSSDGQALDSRTYQWDREGNLMFERELHGTGVERRYGYDSLYRLVQSTASAPQSQTAENRYSIDGAGNRLSVVQTGVSGTYRMDANTPEPADAEVNQYTETPADFRAYDRNGNLSSSREGVLPSRTLVWNYRNQLVEIRDARSGAEVYFQYDVLGRRTGRIARATKNEVTRYCYQGWQVIEEQVGDPPSRATIIYGIKPNEVLLLRHLGSDFFGHEDQLSSLRLVTSRGTEVLDRLAYSDYGERTLLISGDQGPTYLTEGRGFTGAEYDSEFAATWLRTRHLDHAHGVFWSRDLLGVWGDLEQLGNPYTYVGNRPTIRIDPFGLKPCGEQQGCAGYVWDYLGEPQNCYQWPADSAKACLGSLAEALAYACPAGKIKKMFTLSGKPRHPSTSAPVPSDISKDKKTWDYCWPDNAGNWHCHGEMKCTKDFWGSKTCTPTTQVVSPDDPGSRPEYPLTFYCVRCM